MSEQSITIEGVPTSVTREQVSEALRVLGLDADHVVSFGGDAECHALHVEVHSDGRPAVPGRYRWTADGKKPATHRLTIPILDKEPPA